MKKRKNGKDSQNAKIAHFAQIVVGGVGGSEGSRHVANVTVGGWYEERRSGVRQLRLLPPRDNIVICPAAVGELGAGHCQFAVISSPFLVGGHGC